MPSNLPVSFALFSICAAFAAAPTNRAGDASAVALSDLQILDRARAANVDVYASLQSFVCNEEIHRFKGSLNGQNNFQLDDVTARLSFERGVEQYSNIQQDNHSRPSMSSLTGAWSEGEFGTLLLQTQKMLLGESVEFDSFEQLKGEQTAKYHFNVSAQKSPWDLTVSQQHYRLPFRTDVWVSVGSGQILKIERATTAIYPETHISQLQWSIALDYVVLNGRAWLLPVSGQFSVAYSGSKHREWNQISFGGYQRYGSQTALKFE